MGLVMKIRMTDILQDNSLKNYYLNGEVVGFEFQARLSNYRGHFLSTIDRLGVKVNDEEVEQDQILFCLKGKEFSIEELKHQSNEFWNVTTPAAIRVRKPGGLNPGNYKISFELILRNPYLPRPGSTKEHDYIPIDSCDEKHMDLK